MIQENQLEIDKALLERIDNEKQLKIENQKIYISLILIIFTAAGFLYKELNSSDKKDILLFFFTFLSVCGFIISFQWGAIIENHYKIISTIQESLSKELLSKLGNIDFANGKSDESILPMLAQYVFSAGFLLCGALPSFIKQYCPGIAGLNIENIYLKFYLFSLPLFVILGIIPGLITKPSGYKFYLWWCLGIFAFPFAIALALLLKAKHAKMPCRAFPTWIKGKIQKQVLPSREHAPS